MVVNMFTPVPVRLGTMDAKNARLAFAKARAYSSMVKSLDAADWTPTFSYGIGSIYEFRGPGGMSLFIVHDGRRSWQPAVA